MLTMGMNSATTSRTSVIGRLVRRTRLDEVPRFYNVLIGDMSLIGPRPLLPQDLPEQPIERFDGYMVGGSCSCWSVMLLSDCGCRLYGRH
jgi:lipopolysaccharide/colanic/teichoic acid biosynthesis glycosyltransferase